MNVEGPLTTLLSVLLHMAPIHTAIFSLKKSKIAYGMGTEPSAGSHKQITEAELKRSLSDSEFERLLLTQVEFCVSVLLITPQDDSGLKHVM